jgi:hypothetical protein
MNGIVVAGDTGFCLLPLTAATSNHPLALGNHPTEFQTTSCLKQVGFPRGLTPALSLSPLTH